MHFHAFMYVTIGRRHDEMFLLFGQGILERDRCLKTLELFAEKVIPRFR